MNIFFKSTKHKEDDNNQGSQVLVYTEKIYSNPEHYSSKQFTPKMIIIFWNKCSTITFHWTSCMSILLCTLALMISMSFYIPINEETNTIEGVGREEAIQMQKTVCKKQSQNIKR